MAIWQYTFELIPKDDLEIIGLGNYKGEVDYNNIRFWRNGDYEVGYFDTLTGLLSKGKSWSNDIVLYGNEEKTCIKFLIEDDKISEVVIRIDFREDYSKLLSEIIEFCGLHALLLLDEEHNVLPLNQTSIISLIKNSIQYIHLQNLMKNEDS